MILKKREAATSNTLKARQTMKSWFGLVWFGLVWFGLVWFGLVWFGLVWFGEIETAHWRETKY